MQTVLRASVLRCSRPASLDAAGKGGLVDAITLAGGVERVITSAHESALTVGVRFKANPTSLT